MLLPSSSQIISEKQVQYTSLDFYTVFDKSSVQSPVEITENAINLFGSGMTQYGNSRYTEPVNTKVFFGIQLNSC